MRLALRKAYRDLICWGRKFRSHPPEPTTIQLGEENSKAVDFFILPPEIRDQIYRLLLAPQDEKRWIHLAILRCCRRFNEEGTPVLYRDQTFRLASFVSPKSLLKVWPPTSGKFGLVTRMVIPRGDPVNNVINFLSSDLVNVVLSKLPALSDVEIHLTYSHHDPSLVFLHQVRGQLDRIERVVLVLAVTPCAALTSDTPKAVLHQKYPIGYGALLHVPRGYLGRGMEIAYQPPKAEFMRFGAPAILRLTLTKGTSVMINGDEGRSSGRVAIDD